MFLMGERIPALQRCIIRLDPFSLLFLRGPVAIVKIETGIVSRGGIGILEVSQSCLNVLAFQVREFHWSGIWKRLNIHLLFDCRKVNHVFFFFFYHRTILKLPIFFKSEKKCSTINKGYEYGTLNYLKKIYLFTGRSFAFGTRIDRGRYQSDDCCHK